MFFHNPVFHRESRVRWRSWRAFALLFLYAMSLSSVFGWSYATNGAGDTQALNSPDLAVTGREMFRTLQMMQMVAWLLIVPILTSTIISSERERGLLEALQLSCLRARDIIGGKLGALLLFVNLLLLAGAPVTSICFLLGGVAPEEFLKSLLLQAMTILLCSALGLFYSAQARRSLIAVRNSFIAMLIFAFATAYAFDLNAALGWNELKNVAALFNLMNPLRAQVGVFDDFVTTYPELARLKWIAQPFLITLGGLALFALLFLRGALRGVRRVFDDAQWLERKRYLTWRNGGFTWRAANLDEAAFDRWRNEKPLSEAKDIKAKTSALFDTPLATFIHFQNPVLQREVRGKLRLRRYPKPVSVVMIGLAFLGGLAYMFAVFSAWSDKNTHQDIWSATMFCALFAITLALPLMGASALPRERDNGTWEMLEISLLSPRELLTGKLLAPLFFVVLIFVLLLPILLPTVCYFDLHQSRFYDGPALPQALAALFLLAATCFCYTVWGMWLSSFFRTPVTAMAVTLVSMLVIVGVLPWLIDVFFATGSADFMILWHPWATMDRLMEMSHPSGSGEILFKAQDAVFNISFLVTTGFLLLSDLNRRLRKAWRLSRISSWAFRKSKSTFANETA